VPEIVKCATDEYFEEMDVVGDFIEMCTIKDIAKMVSIGELYEIYQYWCDFTDTKPYSRNSISRTLNERGFKTKKINNIKYKLGLYINNNLIDKLRVVKKSCGIEEKFNYDKSLSGTIGTIFRDFLEVPYEELLRNTLQKPTEYRTQKPTDSDFIKINRTRCRKCDKCNQEYLEDELKKGPMGLDLICNNCQVQIINEYNKRIKTPKPENKNIETTKIKLLITRSDFSVNGKQYSLNKGDITEIPTIKAQDMIKEGKATAIIGDGTK